MSPYDIVYGQAEQQYGLPSGLLAAIAKQENVNPAYNNPLGLSTASGVMHLAPEDATARIMRQAQLLSNPSGPYADFAKTKNIDDLAKVYSPVGASNDINSTNATEAAGIRSSMPQQQTHLGNALAAYNALGSSGSAPTPLNLSAGAPTPAPAQPASNQYAFGTGSSGMMSTLGDYGNAMSQQQTASQLGSGIASIFGNLGRSISQSSQQGNQQAMAMLQKRSPGASFLQSLLNPGG